jgi:hypothetical protein
MQRKLVCLLAALALLAASLPAQPPTEDPEVAKGVREVEEGELDAGIFTLDAAARRLLGNPAGRRELGRAYLYLGIAYVGKAQETLAKARFRDALQQQGGLSLSPDQFPPKVIALFEAARQELGQASAATAPAAPARAEAPPKKTGSKAPLILLGVAGAAAAGIAVAAGGSGGGQAAATTTPTQDTRRTLVFGPELLTLVQRQKEFDVFATASGMLEAKVQWREPNAVLIVYLYDPSPLQQLASTGPTSPGVTFAQISANVAAKPYRVGVVHNTSATAFQSRSDGTFTLEVKIP